ncbi:hypothetical protein [Croceicoccus mobilis]|nr:hypothetical protein [Croceicoccus mobilis]
MTMGRQRDFPEDRDQDMPQIGCDTGQDRDADPASAQPLSAPAKSTENIMSTPAQPETPSRAPIGMIFGLVLGCVLWAIIIAGIMLAWSVLGS